jgi:hypothetical protein
MDNLFIFGIISLIVIFLAIILFIHRQNHTIHKIKPTIVTPSYWITPTGRSWYPPPHRYPYLYSSPTLYQSNYLRYYNNLNNPNQYNYKKSKKQSKYKYYKEPSSSPSPPSARYVKSINSSKISKQPKSITVEQFL